MARITTLLLIIASIILGVTLLAAKPQTLKIEEKPPLVDFNRDVNIILTGDVMLGRSTMAKILELNDSVYPFRKVADKLKAADIVFVNLENPVIKDCKPHLGGFTFCTTPLIAEGLNFAGIDIVNLANNHSQNYGRKGLKETEEILTQKGIKWVGDGNLEIIDKKGTKFGFLGFDLTVKDLTQANIDLIKRSDPQVDVLIVAVHWGIEYTPEPTKLQRSQAAQIVAAGADVIAGSHPHWVQVADTIAGRPVYYSMGNFVFDQMWSEETKKGVAISLTYKDGELKERKEYPTYMSSWAQPDWVQ